MRYDPTLRNRLLTFGNPFQKFDSRFHQLVGLYIHKVSRRQALLRDEQWFLGHRNLRNQFGRFPLQRSNHYRSHESDTKVALSSLQVIFWRVCNPAVATYFCIRFMNHRLFLGERFTEDNKGNEAGLRCFGCDFALELTELYTKCLPLFVFCAYSQS